MEGLPPAWCEHLNLVPADVMSCPWQVLGCVILVGQALAKWRAGLVLDVSPLSVSALALGPGELLPGTADFPVHCNRQ